VEYNSHPHSVTGFNPYYLVFGQNLSLSETVLLDVTKEPEVKSVWEDNLQIAANRIKVAHQKESEQWNNHIKWSHRVFKVGDEVLMWRIPPKTNFDSGSHQKLQSGWDGPYRVMDKMEGRDVYRV